MRETIFGVGFDPVTIEEAVGHSMERLSKEGFGYVVTPNPEIVNLAREDALYQDVLNGASLVLADGIGIVYAGKILGKPIPQRAPGIEFAQALMGQMAQSGHRLYLLGAKPGTDGSPSVAQLAAENLKRDYPGLQICGTGDGYFKDEDSAKVLQDLREAKADVVFVCLGAPRQEKWMAQYGKESGAKLMVGLGGCLDVFSGQVQRAPAGWQKLGLEWLYRLLHDPKRIGRMSKLPLFLCACLWARLRGRDV